MDAEGKPSFSAAERDEIRFAQHKVEAARREDHFLRGLFRVQPSGNQNDIGYGNRSEGVES